MTFVSAVPAALVPVALVPVALVPGPGPAGARRARRAGMLGAMADRGTSETAPGKSGPERRTTVYTDGACLGNPGPGGWAWAVPGGRWRSGAAARTTNQRMEISAALDAARALEGPLEVVSDSTYVVNCFRDGWWEGWLARGWVGASQAEGGQPGSLGAAGRAVPELTGAPALPLGEGPRR